tara:strand:+ start:28300 stop:29559 length:1260 start_codon:yes stop_codon:yes gene_type:complete
MNHKETNIELKDAVHLWQQIIQARGNDKLELLKHANEVLVEACHLAYNPYITLGIKKIRDYERDHDCIEFPYWDAFTSVVGKLSRRELTGNTAMNALTFVLSQVPVEEAAFLECIVGRDLKWGLQAKSINKIHPRIIPTFDVALAQKVTDLDSLNYPVMIQPKLDGVRCIAITDYDGKVKLFSRRGKILGNFPHIEERLSQYKNMVFDGEIMDGEFQNLMTQVHRKSDVDTSNAIYNVFDFMTRDEWDNQNSEFPYSRRYDILKSNFELAVGPVQLVEIWKVKDSEELMGMHSNFLQRGYEGTMIKDPKATYKFKRSKALLKYKPVQTIDLEVIGMVEGTGKHKGTLGAVICRYYNSTVNIGSGFDDVERAAIWDMKEDFNGSIIEVQYQDATTNKNGENSLRFPVYLGTRCDKEVADC